MVRDMLAVGHGPCSARQGRGRRRSEGCEAEDRRDTAIDRASRGATLSRSDGGTFTVQAGPDAVNFDRVEIKSSSRAAAPS
jgi:hypothetical protein